MRAWDRQSMIHIIEQRICVRVYAWFVLAGIHVRAHIQVCHHCCGKQQQGGNIVAIGLRSPLLMQPGETLKCFQRQASTQAAWQQEPARRSRAGACENMVCMWRGVMWRGVEWRGVAWRDVTWRDVTWRDMVWCYVIWSDLIWSDVGMGQDGTGTGTGMRELHKRSGNVNGKLMVMSHGEASVVNV